MHDLHHSLHFLRAQLSTPDLKTGLRQLLRGLGFAGLVLDFETECHRAGELDAHIEHAASRLLAESTVPSTCLNLESCREEELSEATLKCYLRRRSELGLQVFDSFVEDGDRDLDAEEGLENCKNLELGLH